jgi:hypothetical protein
VTCCNFVVCIVSICNRKTSASSQPITAGSPYLCPVIATQRAQSRRESTARESDCIGGRDTNSARQGCRMHGEETERG